MPCAIELIDEMLEMDEASIADLTQPKQPEWLKGYIKFKFQFVRLNLDGAQRELAGFESNVVPNAKLSLEVGDSLYRQGDYTMAMFYFREAYTKDPHSEKLLGKYINTLRALDNRETLNSVVTKKTSGAYPRSCQALHGLSRLWELDGKVEEASVLCQKSCELNPLNLEALVAKDDFRVALSLQKNIQIYEEFRLAAVVASNCIENMPLNYRGHVLLGEAYFFENDPDGGTINRAIACFKDAARLAPNCSTPILWLALVERNLHRLRSAEALIQNYIRTKLCPVATAQLGFLFLLMKEIDKALECFDRAIRLQGNTRLAKRGKIIAKQQKENQKLNSTDASNFVFSFDTSGPMDPLFDPFFSSQ
ncbi:hypothetical protein L0F63_003987 [Massospora cicadina]|nr:hypothetical protein L0F63_003987 [Massospora cicadina]